MLQLKLNRFVCFAGLLGVLVGAGCSSAKSPNTTNSGGMNGAACTPNATTACSCPGSTVMGVETCGPSGVYGICAGCPTGGGSGFSGSAGTFGGTAGTTAGSFGGAGITGTAGTTAGSFGGAGITGGAGTGAGTGGGMGCTAPEMCQTFGPIKFCGAGMFPDACTMVGMTCGASGGSCVDGMTLGVPGTYCIKTCM